MIAPHLHSRFAATTDQLLNGTTLPVTIDDIAILLCKIGGTYFAVENRCSHLGKPLDRGRLSGHAITCPFHGACFDVRTGASTGFPKCRAIRQFATSVEGDEVRILLPAGA